MTYLGYLNGKPNVACVCSFFMLTKMLHSCELATYVTKPLNNF